MPRKRTARNTPRGRHTRTQKKSPNSRLPELVRPPRPPRQPIQQRPQTPLRQTTGLRPIKLPPIRSPKPPKVPSRRLKKKKGKNTKKKSKKTQETMKVEETHPCADQNPLSSKAKIRPEKNCDGKENPITYEDIVTGNGVCVDTKCYDTVDLIKWLKHNPTVPHNRHKLTPSQVIESTNTNNNQSRGKNQTITSSRNTSSNYSTFSSAHVGPWRGNLNETIWYE